ncbi:MAG: energy-coupling factor transporter transmembrane protein EcfT [Anaerolineae bacterium]|nr:energy-coupling factor transporter transmembrane protein EcfT [Anaerolineae bacterium]
MAQTMQPVRRMRRTLLGTVPITSPLYQLHPATRFVSLLFLSVVSMFIDLPEINIAFLILILLYMRWARVDISGLRIYLPLMFTVAIFMFTVSIVFPHADLTFHSFEFLGATFYFESLYWTFASYWRLVAMLFGTIQYFSTNRERDTLVAVRSLKIPFAVTYFLSLALRAAGMFMEDMRTIREAERARGLDESSMSLSDRAKLYVMYMIPLFTLAIRRADEISNALYARGYTISGKVEGGGERSDYVMTKYPIKSIDVALIILQVALFATVAIMRLGFGVFAVDQSPLRQYLLALLSGG